jgi:hypothetical protein
MSRDQTIGTILVLVSVMGLMAYAWLLYSFAMLVLQVTAFVAVASVLVILGWIGWTMASTARAGPLETGSLSRETPTGTEKIQRSISFRRGHVRSGHGSSVKPDLQSGDRFAGH